MPRSGSKPWKVVPREIMRSGQAPLPPLVIISSTHGWGKTTWMRQYAGYVEEHTGLRPYWVKNRNELVGALETDSPQAIFVDMLTPTLRDPLWEQIGDYAETHPDSMVVLSTIDRVCPDLVSRTGAWEVWENTLAFSDAELVELAETNFPSSQPLEVALLSDRLRGHPHLVRRHLERLRFGHVGPMGTNPDAPTERLLLRFFHSFGGRLRARSCYLEMILEGAAFRRFDVSMLESGWDMSEAIRISQFERLQMSALGTFQVDQWTGRETFEWSASSWEALQLDFPERATLEARQRAMERTVQAGAETLALFYLLDMGVYDEAETYVERNLRKFLSYTPSVVRERLFQLPTKVLEVSPNLALLTGELMGRKTRSRSGVDARFHLALNAINMPKAGDPLGRFTATVREGFGRVSLGDRTGARESLKVIMDLLGTDKNPGPVRVAAAEDADEAARLGDELFLAFWTAIQIDAHGDALVLSSLAREWTPPGTQMEVAAVLTAVTEEVFAGFRPEFPEGTPPGAVHTDALVLLEEGKGREALKLVRGLEVSAKTWLSRSAADALILSVKALVSVEMLTVKQVEEVVQRSTAFWVDGIPSTFIAQSASLAYLGLERPDLSREVLERFKEPDWFISVAWAIHYLVVGEPGRSLEVLATLDKAIPVPRGAALVETLTAAAYFSSGHPEAARSRLDAMWLKFRPGLVRYVLRFVPQEVLKQMYEQQDDMHPGLAEILEQSTHDVHMLAGSQMLSLTGSEVETLELLSADKTYQEIAEARFVSVNTVRTQVRGLYKKLQVRSREDAVAKAEQLGLL